MLRRETGAQRIEGLTCFRTEGAGRSMTTIDDATARRRLTLTVAALVALLGSSPALAERITIVTPYCGMEENTYLDDQYGLRLEDSALLKGLYLQAIDTDRYQWNLFVYQTSDINYSDLLGFNFIYDRYFGKSARTQNVAGVGLNYLTVDLAGEHVPTAYGPLDALTLDMDTLSLYARVGRYYRREQGGFRWTALPWVGGQWDHSTGDGLADYPGPGSAAFKIDEDRCYAIAGLNLKADYRHFLQAEVKHPLTFDRNDCYHKTVVMVNFFMTRNVGLSYRYCRQGMRDGRDSYSLFGLAMVF